MSVTNGQQIQQTDVDALATLGNSKLLPLINGIVSANPSAPDNYGQNWYDKFTAGVPGYDPAVMVNPQPDYAFTDRTFTNLASSSYDGSGNYSITTAADGDYDLILGVNDQNFAVDGKTYSDDARFVYIKSGTVISLKGTAGKSVTSKVGLSLNWGAEFNRIRGDLFNLFFYDYTEGDGGMYLNSSMLVSGPWVVGVNDNDTFLSSAPGVLNGSAEIEDVFSGNPAAKFCIFKNVAFAFRDSDAPAGFTVSGQMKVPDQSFSAISHDLYYPSLVNLQYDTSQGGSLTMLLNWHFHWSGHGSDPGTPPATSAFTLSASPSTGVTWSTSSGSSAGEYVLTATIALSVSASDTGSIDFTVTPPANYTFDGETYLDGEGGFFLLVKCSFSGSLPLVSASTRTALNALLPSGSAVQIKCAESGGDHQKLRMGIGGLTGSASYWADVSWTLSSPLVKGCWIATTLPVAGNNVFIDQDMPPHVGKIIPNGEFAYDGTPVKIAVSDQKAMDGSAANPFTSTMRQAAPPNTPGVLPGLPGIQPQPAQWLVRRDTDFVPFDLGFNTGYATERYSGQGAGSNYSVDVAANTTAIRVRLVANGSSTGWSGGQFQYGSPLEQSLRVYVRKSGPATSLDYDFFTDTNGFNLPGDRPLNYLQTLLNSNFWLLIVDLDNTGIEFDVVIELDSGVPTRRYFPCDTDGSPVAECYSLQMMSQIGVGSGPFNNINQPLPGITLNADNPAQNPDSGSKPVPQSGYCIFKVRATRMPVDPGTGVLAIPSSGSAIVVTLGQNVLQTGPPSPFTPPPGFGGPVGFGLGMGGGANMGMGGQVGESSLVFQPFKNSDGSNLTITIGADGSTTGDVAVFIPCIDGNEIVWQAGTMVKVEAWANWQPLFFNNKYARGLFPFRENGEQLNADVPIILQYAMSFLNNFNPANQGWDLPDYNGTLYKRPSLVQFPVSSELYNDLYTALGLIT